MSQVSKRVLSKDIEIKLLEVLLSCFTYLSSKSDSKKFLFDLLSTTEQTMLAKRLGIALLLKKQYTYNEIKEILKVSQETIARVNMSLTYRGDGYNMIIRRLNSDQKIKDSLEKIGHIAIELLPMSNLKKTLQAQKRSTKRQKTPLE